MLKVFESTYQNTTLYLVVKSSFEEKKNKGSRTSASIRGLCENIR